MSLIRNFLEKTLFIFVVGIFILQLMPVRGEESSNGNKVVNYGVGVTLTGKITTRLEYGAPGFGEDPKTDEKENIFLLVLDKPVDVHVDKTRPSDTDTDDFDGVKEMQVVFSGKKSLVRKVLSKKITGKRVKMTGTLFQAHTGHHHTNVLIDWETLKILK